MARIKKAKRQNDIEARHISKWWLVFAAVVGLIGACAGTFIIEWGWNVYLSIMLCLLIGIAIGAWQGFWIAYVGIPPFICTL